MIIGLSGFAGAGKDVVGAYLVENYGFTRFGLADKVKELLLEVDPRVALDEGGAYLPLSRWQKVHGWDYAKSFYPVRNHLVTLGHGARKVLGPDVWLDALKAEMPRNKPVVITDVRYTNEYEFCREFGEMWRIERPGVGPANDSPSENELTGFEFDRMFNNRKDVQYLEKLVGIAMRCLDRA